MSRLWKSTTEVRSDAPMDVRVWMEERLIQLRGGSRHDPDAARHEGRILFSGRSGDVAVHLRDGGTGSSLATNPLV